MHSAIKLKQHSVSSEYSSFLSLSKYAYKYTQISKVVHHAIDNDYNFNVRVEEK